MNIRSHKSSPNGSRANDCYETKALFHGQDYSPRQCKDSDCSLAAAAEQIVSAQGLHHVHYRNITVAPNVNQQVYLAQNRYFNALDAAANIRSAMKRNP
jgi:hypothetical protein